MQKNTCYLFLVLLVTSCSTPQLDPLEDSGVRYSVYGSLKLGEEENYIRVRDVHQFFFSESEGWDNFNVSLTNLSSGITTILEDSVVEFSVNATYNFKVNQAINPSEEYQLVISGDDPDNNLVANTRIPGYTNASPPVDTTRVCTRQLDFGFGNVQPDEFVFMEVGFENGDYVDWKNVNSIFDFERISDDSVHIGLSVKNLLVAVYGATQYTVVKPPYQQEPQRGCNAVEGTPVRIRYYHFSEEWEPVVANYFMANRIVESGVTENGIGFFGSYYLGNYTFMFGDD